MSSEVATDTEPVRFTFFWGPKPTTVDTIRLIRKTIGNAALIKAAGGVRTLDTIMEMYQAGCDRFGLGVRTSEAILKEARERAYKTE